MELQWNTMKKKLAKVNKLVFALALFVLLVGILVLGANAKHLTEDAPETVEFTESVRSGYPAWADMTLLDLYAANDKVQYHIYIDEQDRVGIVMLNRRLNDEDVKALLAAESYGDTVRVEGIVRSLPSDVVEFLKEDNWYGMEVNMSTYLDVGDSWQGENTSLVAFAVILLLAFLLLLLASRATYMVLNRCKKQLEEKNLMDEAIRQFETAETYPVGAAVSQDFVYGLGSGVVLPIDGILWTFMRTRRQRYGQVFYDLILKDQKREYTLCTVRKQEQTAVFNEIVAVLSARNENMLLGHTKENKAAYKAMKKQ